MLGKVEKTHESLGDDTILTTILGSLATDHRNAQATAPRSVK